VALNQLKDLNGKTLVKKLAREPGKRDSRYIHLLSDASELNLAEPITSHVGDVSSENQSQLVQRVSELEQQVIALTKQVSILTDLIENS